MSLLFKGKRVWISGAGSGIGKAAAILFAKEGADLILLGRREDKLKETEAEVKKAGAGNVEPSNVELVPIDLTDTTKVEEHFKKLGPLDVAVNNAAFEGRRDDSKDLTLKDFDDVFNINVRALFHCQSKQIENMRSNNVKGSIVNLSSISAYKAIPTSSIYCASKAAVVALSKTAALEQAPHGIRINIVAPGGTETDMLRRIYPNLSPLASNQPLKRLSSPQEIAEAIVWLSSSKASGVIGHQLIVDGGSTL